MIILTVILQAMQMTIRPTAVALAWAKWLTNWRHALTTFLSGFMKITCLQMPPVSYH